MGKTTAKNAVILINGYLFSTYATTYDIKADAGKVEVQGFSDGSKNYIPGLPSMAGALDMLWESSANSVHLALKSRPTGVLTIIPEGYVLGNSTISFPIMQSNYAPKGAPADALKIGTINFESYGNNAAREDGVALAHGTITTTTTGTGFAAGGVTAAVASTLHVWTPTASDTYVVKVQQCATIGGVYTDLVTFAANGTTRTVERQTLASGAIAAYVRVLATRTGAGGDSFGFSVHFCTHP
jgi:hypothetical protein